MCHNPSRAVLTQDHAGFAGSASRERCPKCRLRDGRKGRLNNNSRSQLVYGCVCLCWCSNLGHRLFSNRPMRVTGGIGRQSLSHYRGRAVWPASLWLLSFRRTARVVGQYRHMSRHV